MALTPIDEKHAQQILAGTAGRKEGHSFEATLANTINGLKFPFVTSRQAEQHVFAGDPASLLLSYIGTRENMPTIASAVAISTGALATSEEGKKLLSIDGTAVGKCKSDIVLSLTGHDGRKNTIGVSVKQCNNKTPTNAQLYFSTALGFSGLLRANGVIVSENAVLALRQFCGDPGFQPGDASSKGQRLIDPRRYFWEEIQEAGRVEWETILSQKQEQVSKLLLQKAYLNDPFVPDYLLHKTKAAPGWGQTEVAIYSIDELVSRSRRYQNFVTKPYSVRKGSYKDPVGITHDAPRFGVIQMQRGGQAQHPNQLQFNLAAGYFYNI
jgi:hypothetical protein